MRGAPWVSKWKWGVSARRALSHKDPAGIVPAPSSLCGRNRKISANLAASAHCALPAMPSLPTSAIPISSLKWVDLLDLHRTHLQSQVSVLKAKTGHRPGLRAIHSAMHSDEAWYVDYLSELAADVGVDLAIGATEDKRGISSQIQEWNSQSHVHGIVVDVAWPHKSGPHMDRLREYVCPSKDVACHRPVNLGKFLGRACDALFVPSIAGIVQIALWHSNIDAEGKRVLVITGTASGTASGTVSKSDAKSKQTEDGSQTGIHMKSSHIHGNLVAQALLCEDSTVTVCDCKSPLLLSHLPHVDLVVVAANLDPLVSKALADSPALIMNVGNAMPHISHAHGPIHDSLQSRVWDYMPNQGLFPLVAMMILSNTIRSAFKVS